MPNPVVENVKRICADVASVIPGAEIVAPLPVWDALGHPMGVQIKAPKMMQTMPCEMVCNFVLSDADWSSDIRIKEKATAAVAAMRLEVQMQIRPIKAEKAA